MFVKLERWFFNMAEVNDRRIIVQANQNEDTKFQNIEIDGSDEDELDPPDIVGYYILDLQTGGVSTLPRTIQNFDLTHSTSPMLWKRAHPIITNPLGGDGVAFDGKIFYFRSCEDFSSFCEVLDPTQPDPHWHCIESKPGQGLILAPPVLADYDNKRIIVCLHTPVDSSSLYAYYPSEDRWECVVETFLQKRWFSSPSIVTMADGVIYVYYRDLKGFFQAYDIDSKEWLEVKVSPAVKHSESYYLPLYHYVSVIHLGKGILCLLGWTDEGEGLTHIHLVQFQLKVLNVDDKKEVRSGVLELSPVMFAPSKVG
ncbi:hypothetical protein POM88_041763 [Heracleum sosnowskyi]|uniref:Uncharacterized protein n=1 Tax=Heracleum sosnowskyi TaxID=360622 RepID=A0AAD8HEV3_9APIA|nr:hypothetical protein POM88_041763 [Heracleum sosnowskyi]